MRKAKYYSCNENDDQLICTDEYEAINEYLDYLCVADWPKEITVYCYAEMDIKKGADHLAGCLLGDFLESLDEEYSHYDRCPTMPNEEMKKAAKVFVDTVIDSYECWACEVIDKKTYDVKKFVDDGHCDFKLSEDSKKIFEERFK